MVVDVDEQVPVLNAFADFAESLETGGVGGNHAIEVLAGGGWLHQAFGVRKGEFLRHAVFVPADYFFALGLERQGKAKLRSDAIAVGTDVARDADGFAAADLLQDAVNDLGMGFHEGGRARSSSSRICSTRLPRSTESSSTKRSLGVYLSTTARPTRP